MNETQQFQIDPDSKEQIQAEQIPEHALSAITPNDKIHDVEVDFSAGQKKDNMTVVPGKTTQLIEGF